MRDTGYASDDDRVGSDRATTDRGFTAERGAVVVS